MTYPYYQKVFHFVYPIDSIDTRVITKEQLQWAKSIYTSTPISDSDVYNKQVVTKMFKTCFPEELL